MIIPALAEKASIVTYDVYGCGDSPKPNDFTAYATEVGIFSLLTVLDGLLSAHVLLLRRASVRLARP